MEVIRTQCNKVKIQFSETNNIWKETSRGLREEGFWGRRGFTIKSLLKIAKKHVFESIFARAVRPKREKTKKLNIAKYNIPYLSRLNYSRFDDFLKSEKAVFSKNHEQIPRVF